MSRRQLKVTGFTRFFLMLVIVAPIAYIAASYYNGQDGIQNIKNLLGIDQRTESKEVNSIVDENTKKQDAVEDSSEDIKILKEQLDAKNRLIDQLMMENAELKRKLESLEKTLKESQ